MTAKKLTLLLVFFSNILAGQVPKDFISIEDNGFNNYYFTKKNIPSATIKLLHFNKEDIDSLIIDYTIVTPLKEKQIRKTGKFTNRGVLELEIESAFPCQQGRLSIDGLFSTQFFLNKDLVIELDAKVLKSKTKATSEGIRYLGSDGKLNDYLNHHTTFEVEKQKELQLSLRKLKRKRQLSTNEFIAELDSIYSIIYEVDYEFNKKYPSNYKWVLKMKS